MTRFRRPLPFHSWSNLNPAVETGDKVVRPILRSNFRSQVGSGALRLTRAAHQRRVVNR